MLKRLKVNNYALIEELDVSFGKNLNIFTGQTGAGKSIIIGSINLIVGDKASTEMIRTGVDEGFVEATFDIKKTDTKLENFRISDQSLIIKRVIAKNGKSHAFLNGKQISIAQLKETLLGKVLLDLGLFGDGTSFGDFTVKEITEILLDMGKEKSGNQKQKS